VRRRMSRGEETGPIAAHASLSLYVYLLAAACGRPLCLLSARGARAPHGRLVTLFEATLVARERRCQKRVLLGLCLHSWNTRNSTRATCHASDNYLYSRYATYWIARQKKTNCVRWGVALCLHLQVPIERERQKEAFRLPAPSAKSLPKAPAPIGHGLSVSLYQTRERVR